MFSVRAGDLVQHGECSPQCLLADSGDKGCDCRCGGKYHGLLADAELETGQDARPWWQQCNYGGRSAASLARNIPVSQSLAQHNEVYQKCKALNEPFLVVDQDGSTWSVIHDVGTLPRRSRELFAQWNSLDRSGKVTRSEAVDLFFYLLLRQRRARIAGPPTASEHVFISGFRDKEEAMTVATLVSDAWDGELKGIASAVTVLRGQQAQVAGLTLVGSGILDLLCGEHSTGSAAA